MLDLPFIYQFRKFTLDFRRYVDALPENTVIFICINFKHYDVAQLKRRGRALLHLLGLSGAGQGQSSFPLALLRGVEVHQWQERR
jgi:hypothetical protein